MRGGGILSFSSASYQQAHGQKRDCKGSLHQRSNAHEARLAEAFSEVLLQVPGHHKLQHIASVPVGNRHQAHETMISEDRDAW